MNTNKFIKAIVLLTSIIWGLHCTFAKLNLELRDFPGMESYPANPYFLGAGWSNNTLGFKIFLNEEIISSGNLKQLFNISQNGLPINLPAMDNMVKSYELRFEVTTYWSQLYSYDGKRRDYSWTVTKTGIINSTNLKVIINFEKCRHRGYNWKLAREGMEFNYSVGSIIIKGWNRKINAQQEAKKAAALKKKEEFIKQQEAKKAAALKKKREELIKQQKAQAEAERKMKAALEKKLRAEMKKKERIANGNITAKDRKEMVKKWSSWI